MLQTFNRQDWNEDKQQEYKIDNLMIKSTPDEVRALFPYRVITKQRLTAYGIPAGEELAFARVRHEVSAFPIHAMIGVAGEFKHATHPRKLYLNSDEVYLIEA